MSYVRKIDFGGDLDARIVQRLVKSAAGEAHCDITFVRTPPGEGSPAGLHSHAFEQIFYLIHGEMNLEIAGERMVASAGSIIVFPAGVLHRNWNASDEPSAHLSFAIPVTGAPSDR